LRDLIAVFALSWGFWKHQYPQGDDIPVKFLPITTSSAPAGYKVLPEQRRVFALEFGEKFKAKYPDAAVSTSKDLHTSLLIRGGMINEPFALAMKDNTGIIGDMREMGFKRLIMTDGKTAWVVDLKN
jgi:hypothetical protein